MEIQITQLWILHLEFVDTSALQKMVEIKEDMGIFMIGYII